MTFPSFLQLINFSKEPVNEDEDDADLSDSEDSVYSGLEDSGSDSEEEEEEELDEEEGSDDDVDEDTIEEDQSQQVTFNLGYLCYGWLAGETHVRPADSPMLSSSDGGKEE